MKKRAAVFVVKEGHILLMFRRKKGREYYAIPGGTLEENETPYDAAVRELKEETTLTADIEFCFTEKDGVSECSYYIAKTWDGTPVLSGEELERNSEQNHYALEWIPLDKLHEIPLMPEHLAEKVGDILC